MTKEWTAESLRELALGYMPSAVLLAAAELDIYSVLAREPMHAERLAAALQTDLRATTVLADALVAVGVVEKFDTLYSPAPGIIDTLAADATSRVLPLLQLHATRLRLWGRLAEVVKTGRPVAVAPSIRGAEADLVAYIETMEVNAWQAPQVVAGLGPLEFEHLLDIGCGTGSWPIAFLRAVPGARATLYDLPEALPIARSRVEAAGLTDRVSFVEGDFTVDEALPGGADLALVFGVAHQNSRQENRELFAKLHTALRPGGHILVRGNVMSPDHTAPLFGAMFAILMLVRTESGTTYSFEETVEDLAAAGFEEPKLFRHERDIDSIIRARRRDIQPGTGGARR